MGRVLIFPPFLPSGNTPPLPRLWFKVPHVTPTSASTHTYSLGTQLREQVALSGYSWFDVRPFCP